MSGYTWQLIDWFKANRGRSRTRLAINSNLGFDAVRAAEFIHAVRDIPHIEIYTSNESVGTQAEYIRDGLHWGQWLRNVTTLLEHRHIQAVHSMCTINALCLDSLPLYLDELVRLKQRFGRERMNFTLNILRFPSFQSALVLPDHIRQRHCDALQQWLDQHGEQNYLHQHEVNHVMRLIDYLDCVKSPHTGAVDRALLARDFRKFFDQYDQRRGKDFRTTFPNLVEWYDGL